MTMLYWVYVLKNKQNRTYTGHTDGLSKRYIDHNKGRSYWTSRFKGWRLIYFEIFRTRAEAMKREKGLKSGKGRDELKRKGII